MRRRRSRRVVESSLTTTMRTSLFASSLSVGGRATASIRRGGPGHDRAAAHAAEGDAQVLEALLHVVELAVVEQQHGYGLAHRASAPGCRAFVLRAAAGAMSGGAESAPGRRS